MNYTIMKPLFIVVLVLLFFGCSDRRSDLVSNYLRQHGYPNPEVTISVKRIVNLANLSAGDSLEILEADYDRKKEKFIREYNDLMKSSLALKRNQTERSLIQSSINDGQASIILADSLNNDRLGWISELEKRATEGNAAALINKQKQLVELKRIAGLITKYRANPNVILARTAKVTYTVTNPALDNNFQEITRTFVFSNDHKKILDVII